MAPNITANVARETQMPARVGVSTSVHIHPSAITAAAKIQRNGTGRSHSESSPHATNSTNTHAGDRVHFVRGCPGVSELMVLIPAAAAAGAVASNVVRDFPERDEVIRRQSERGVGVGESRLKNAFGHPADHVG